MSTSRVPIAWGEALPVWWSFYWRAVLLGFAGGFVAGAVGGFIAGSTGHGMYAGLYGAVGGYAAGTVLSMFAMKWTLERHARRISRLTQGAEVPATTA